MIVVGDDVHARQLQRTQLTMSDSWDEDIATLNLSDSEKDGLQVFRNYQRAFQVHAERAFAKEIDAEPFDTAPLERVLALIANEDVRFLPVITCAYVDDLLKAMFKAELPDDVPSGASALFGPYGPLSTLFNRLQLAFVFDMLSPELVQDLDQIRKVRNDLSHSWDITTFQDFFTKGTITDLYPVDTLLAKQEKLQSFPTALEPLKAFRVRLLWLTTRLTYEAAYYPRAKRQRLHPQSALFGPNQPKRLSTVSGLALEASKKVIE